VQPLLQGVEVEAPVAGDDAMGGVVAGMAAITPCNSGPMAWLTAAFALRGHPISL